MNQRYTRYYLFIKPIFKNRVIRNYGYFVFSLITITIFSLFAIRPTFATIISLNKTINEQKIVLDQLNTKTNNLSLGKKAYDNLDPTIQDKLFSLAPNSTSIPKLIDNLNTLASRNEASISGLQFQPTELFGAPKKLSKNAKLEEIEFSLNIRGTYPQFINFISSLIASGRLINLESVNFNKSADDSLTMSINATAYVLKN